MKRKVISFVLIIAMLAMFVPSGLVGTTAYAATEADNVVAYVNGKVGQSYPKGYCLAFVRQMFDDLGYGSSSSCCAYNYGNSYLDSTSRDNIPLGADVFFSGSSSVCDYCGNHCGHIGIYVGDGYIVHAWDGKIQKMTINYIVSRGYTYRGWGYHANIDLSKATWEITKPDTYPSYPNDWFSISHNNTNRYYVRFIQAGLRELGYSLDVDGSFGPGTQSVVKQFQSDNGLASDGEFGPASWSKMVDLLKAKYPNVIAPTGATMNVNGSNFEVGETVTFTFSGNNNTTGFTIGIDKDGSRILTQDVGSPFSISSLEAGDYSAYVTAWNSAGGCDSNRVSFTVLGNYNFEPMASVTDNGRIYTLYDDRVTWKEAKAKCEALGGNLVTITSEHEQEIVNDLRTKGKCQEYWIGLTDEETEGTFKWVTGEPYSYSNWDSGQPDNCSSVEHYVHMWSGGLWNDIAVDGGGRKIGFILEKEIRYIIKYDLNYNYSSGTLLLAPQTKVEGVNLSLSSIIPQRSGFTFLGWSTDKNATTATYNAGDTFTKDADTTLYAVWKEITLSSISIASNPAKTIYNVGDTLDTSGLKLTATYSDTSTKDITSGFTCTPTSLTKAGTQTITVTYNGKTAIFDVTVNKVLTSVAVKTKPSKLTYNVGDTLNTSGLVLTASYNDNSTQDITSGFTCTPTSLNTAGTQTITITYNGKTATFDVTVDVNLAIISDPSNVTVQAGENISFTVKAQGNDLAYQWYYKKAGSSWANGTVALQPLFQQQPMPHGTECRSIVKLQINTVMWSIPNPQP